jgi:hypothetical protein
MKYITSGVQHSCPKMKDPAPPAPATPSAPAAVARRCVKPRSEYPQKFLAARVGLVSVTAYHYYSGDVEVEPLPRCARLTPSRHELSRIAPVAVDVRSSYGPPSVTIDIPVPDRSIIPDGLISILALDQVVIRE